MHLAKSSGNPWGWKIELMSKFQKLQFLKRPLEAGSKSDQVPTETPCRAEMNSLSSRDKICLGLCGKWFPLQQLYRGLNFLDLNYLDFKT